MCACCWTFSTSRPVGSPVKPMSGEQEGPLRIAIVAGEASGDILGADLIRSLRLRYPLARFEGVAGPRMIAAGCESFFPLEKLSVMGLVEVLKHLPELLGLRRQLYRHFSANPPDLFIGIDAPDFNLALERRLKAQGIPTAHYVSPSVWAWRQYRVKKIGRSVDLMLTLFPFEADFYRQHQVPVRFVGHPLADMIPETVDKQAVRARLGLPEGPVVALLPGSRGSELGHLAGPFIEAAKLCQRALPDLHFVVPHASAKTRALFEEALAESGGQLPLTALDGQSQDAMAAADVVLLASGTATLEALLLKRPMVVAYKLAPLTYWLASCLIKTPYYSLPNQLVGRACVAEITQHEVSPERLSREVLALLQAGEDQQQLAAFAQVGQQLRGGASERAAEALSDLLLAAQGEQA